MRRRAAPGDDRRRGGAQGAAARGRGDRRRRSDRRPRAEPGPGRLAGHPRARRRAGARAPLDARLRQQPPPVAERLATAVNDVAGEELALAHHGSVAREKRAAIEERLKRGELRAIVATSSLELGIDMGAVDLVVQIESPPSVASGLQRVGRACHERRRRPARRPPPQAPARPPRLRRRRRGSMRAGEVEETFYPRNPLDVLAQQIVAMVSVETLDVDELFERVRRAAPFAELPRGAFEGVLDMLSGRYPSDDFAELRPRVTWDRARGRIEARAGSHRLAVTNAGTIPDRGLYGVFTAGADGEHGTARRRARRGDGLRAARGRGVPARRVVVARRAHHRTSASSCRPPRASRARCRSGTATGRAGRAPSGCASASSSGASREGRVDAAALRDAQRARRAAADALLAYVREQVEATGEVPSDRAIVVERFVDEVGDWRVVVLCPLRHARARAVGDRRRRAPAREVRRGRPALHRRRDGLPHPGLRRAAAGRAVLSFARRDRGHGHARPRRHGALRRALPRVRRARAAAAAPRSAAPHPALGPAQARGRSARRRLEAPRVSPSSSRRTASACATCSTCRGSWACCATCSRGSVRVATVDTRKPSPFASNVLFAFVANFIYDGDAPLAERRAQALTHRPRAGCASCSARRELRELLDPEVIEEHERRLQRLSRPAAHADAVHDLLLAVGDLSTGELACPLHARPTSADAWAAPAAATRDGIFEAPIAGAAPLRGGRGRRAAARRARREACPRRFPRRSPPRSAARSDARLVARYARTHGPFVIDATSRARLGLDREAVQADVEAAPVARGASSRARSCPGAPAPSSATATCSTPSAASRSPGSGGPSSPSTPRALARFLPEWQGIPRRRRGRDALLAVVGELEGCPLRRVGARDGDPAGAPRRLPQLGPRRAVRVGRGRVGGGRAARRERRAHRALPRRAGAAAGRPAVPSRARSRRPIRELLRAARRGLLRRPRARGRRLPERRARGAVEMVWAGEVTNDTLEPLRSRAQAVASEADADPHPRHPRAPRTGPPGSEGRWSLRARGGAAAGARPSAARRWRARCSIATAS